MLVSREVGVGLPLLQLWLPTKGIGPSAGEVAPLSVEGPQSGAFSPAKGPAAVGGQ